MNYSEVIQALNAVLTEQKNKIAEISQTSGGWEAWLQAELWEKWPVPKVLREQKVWGDGRKIDLWFPETRFGVELKCLGLGRLENDNNIFSKNKSEYTDFAKGVLTDVDKVGTLPQAGTGMAIVVIPTWLPEDRVVKLKNALTGKTFEWSWMGNGGFYVGINRSYYL